MGNDHGRIIPGHAAVPRPCQGQVPHFPVTVTNYLSDFESLSLHIFRLSNANLLNYFLSLLREDIQ